MELLRKVFFYLFAFIFIAFCPVLVLYSLGYFITPGHGERLVKTGLIYFSTVPAKASVYVNAKRVHKKTPTLVRNLMPGTYRVRINKKNYKPWMHSISVEAGKASALNKVILIPRVWHAETDSAETYNQLMPLPETDYILLSTGPLLGQYFIYDVSAEKIRPLISQETDLNKASFLNYKYIPKSDYILIEAELEGQRRIVFVNIDDPSEDIKDLSVLLKGQFMNEISWDPEESKYLFFLNENKLGRINLNNDVLHEAFIPEVSSYVPSNKSLYIMDGKAHFIRTDFENHHPETILKETHLYQNLFNSEHYQIKILQEDIMIFISDKGELVSNRLPYHFVDQGVIDAVPDDKKLKLLIFTPAKIGILDFTRQGGDAKIFEQGPDLSWVYQGGTSIKNASWVYDGTHIIFQDGDQIFLLENIPTAEYSLIPIVTVKKSSSFFYSDKLGKLFYLDALSGHLQALELIPKRKMALWDIPEFDFRTDRISKKAKNS